MKIGDPIEIMSACNMKGRIVALRKDGAEVETDDGMTILVPYKEVVPINAADILNLGMRKTKVKSESKPVASQRKTTATTRAPLVVDLHLEKLEGGTSVAKSNALNYQLTILDSYMRENLHHYGRKIIFIHGAGDGVLKKAVRHALKSKYSRNCTFTDAANYDGCAVLVTITKLSECHGLI